MSTQRLIVIVALVTVPWVGSFASPILDLSHVKQKTLGNGLHVVVKEEPLGNVVAAGFCIKAAPLYETAEQVGLSDLARFMVFEAPDKGGRNLFDRLRDLGGAADSYTSPDCTQFRVAMSTPCFTETFGALVKAIFEATFDEATWASELQELRKQIMDARNTPLGTLWSIAWETAFHKHPYGRPTSGTPEGIARYNAKTLADFHRAFYVPNNVSLIVVGDIKAQAVFDLAERTLGAYPSRPVKAPLVVPEPPQADTRTRLEKKEGLRGSLVTYAWRAAPIGTKRDVCSLDLIYAVLGLGPEARLTRALAARDKQSPPPNVEFITKRDPGLFVITTVTKPADEFSARQVVLSEVEKLRTQPLTPAELANAKALTLADYAIENESYVDQIGSLCFYEAIDSFQFACDYEAAINAVTAEDVQRVAHDYLADNNYTLVIIRPRSGSEGYKEASLPW